MYDGSSKTTLTLATQHVRKSSSSSEEMTDGYALSHSPSQHDESFEAESPDSQDDWNLPPLPPVTGIPNQVDKESHEGEDTTHRNDAKKRGPAKKRYMKTYYHSNAEPYSDADASAAMILATGMGRKGESEVKESSQTSI
jgi:hypothetical protein